MKLKIHFLIYITIMIYGSNVVYGKRSTKSDNKQKESIWEQDLGDAFNIEPSTQGLQKVHLKCGADSMYVQLQTESDFEGVMYTKGSFYDQAEPCFVKPNGKSARSLTMHFPLDKCQTTQDGEIYSNVVIVQHDPDLVTPGDAAFALECDFRKPRSINVDAHMQARDRLATGSRITLTSPDPTAPKQSQFDTERQQSVYSETESVTFDPMVVVAAADAKNAQQQSGIRGTVETISISSKIDDEL